MQPETMDPKPETESWRSRINERWNSMPSAARLYNAGWLSALTGVGIVAAAGPSRVVDIIFLTGMACCAIGLLVEAYLWYVQRLDRKIIITAYSIIAVAAWPAATGITSSALAKGIGQDPSYFENSVLLLTPLSFIPIVAILVAAFGTLFMPIAAFFAVKQLARKSQKHSPLFLGRLLGYLFIVMIATQAISSMSPYDALMHRASTYAAYFFDMHQEPSCSSSSSDRIVRLNDDLVIVGRPIDSGVHFQRIPCRLEAEPKPLPFAKET